MTDAGRFSTCANESGTETQRFNPNSFILLLVVDVRVFVAAR